MQDLKDRSKVKNLEDTSVMIFNLIIDILFPDFILFINNYFSESKIAKKLKPRGIIVYETIKSNRLDLSKLLVKIKKNFSKNISYEVLTEVIQNNILLVIWQDNTLVLKLITAYNVSEINDTIFKKRKRFSRTSTNARIILSAFKNNRQNI